MSDHQKGGSPSSVNQPKAAVIDFQKRYEQKKQARSNKWGRRYFISQLPLDKWKREYCHFAVWGALLSNAKHFSKREYVVLSAMMVHQNKTEKLTQALLARVVGMSKAHVSRQVRNLSRAGVVVNIGTPKNQSLAVNPMLGFWDFQALKKDRKGQFPKSDRPDFPPF